MNMLTDLKNRGILDACIVCCDGLKGLPDAIGAIGPRRWCRPHLCTMGLGGTIPLITGTAAGRTYADTPPSRS